MKQALFILAAFLLLAPNILMGQDFEVVSPSPKTISTILACSEKYDDTIIVQNKTDTVLRINLQMLNLTENIWQIKNWSFGKPLMISPYAYDTIYVRFIGYSAAKFYHNGYVLSSSKSGQKDTILATAEVRPYAVGLDESLLSYVNSYFLGVPPYTTKCSTVYARNNTTKSIIISDALIGNFSEWKRYFQLKPLVPLPYVLLPGEDIPLVDICYTPTDPNQEIHMYFTVTSTVDTKTTKVQVNIEATSKKDTIVTKPCISLSASSYLLGPVLFGGEVTDTIFLQSNRYSKKTISDINFSYGDSNNFLIDKSRIPLSVDSLGKSTVIVTYHPILTTPVVNFRHAAGIQFRFNESDCYPTQIEIAGLAMLPTADSISTPLFPDKEYVLGMSSSAASFSQDFHFVNNGLTNTKIVSVGLLDPSPEFVVTNITPTNTLPFTLLPGEKMTVSVLFTPSQVGKVFFNQLVITTEQGIQSVSYPLQGLRTTTSGVTESSNASVSLTLSPNPATESVAVSVKGAGLIEGGTMTDELGKTIFNYTQPQMPEWKWDLNNERVTAGTYFIRVNGKTPEGKPFVVTKRLVVQ